MDNSRGLQGTGLSLLVCCYLPWVMRVGDGGPGGGSPTEEGWGGVGSGLAGLHEKGVPAGELFAVSRNYLILGGAVPAASTGHPNRK